MGDFLLNTFRNKRNCEPLRIEFDNPPNIIGPSDFIELDALISYSDIREQDITAHKVEEGIQITDHIVVKPEALSFTGLVTNIREAETVFGTSFDFGSKVLGDVFSTSSIPVVMERLQRDMDEWFRKDGSHVQAFEKINKAMDLGTLCKVFTRRKVYKDMLIRKLDAPIEAQLGDALQFSIEMIQIRKVSGQTITVPSVNFGKQTSLKDQLVKPNEKQVVDKKRNQKGQFVSDKTTLPLTDSQSNRANEVIS